MPEADRILIPPSPDLVSLLTLTKNLRGTESLHVDFSQLAFLTPSSALLLSSTLRTHNVDATIDVNAPGFGYAAHVGFFDASGIHVGLDLGSAAGNDNYTPLKRVQCNDVKLSARRTHIRIPEVLEARAENLARVLTRNQHECVRRFVTFAVREILRNCVEHARSFDFWYAGQYWPNSNTVEVAILDEGIGILESLRSNPEHMRVETELDAIKLALRPGITGVTKPQRRGDYANSGYGLYMTRHLCTRGSGSFGIVSNRSGVIITEDGEREVDGVFRGTLLQLRMDTKWLQSLDMSFIEQLAAEGEREARELTGHIRPASSGSKSITLSSISSANE